MERQEPPGSERDAELVEAVRAGSRDAFAQLVEAWFDRCWEVSWRILRDRDRAAEVAQDVMLAAWQKLDTLSNPGAFGGWVLRMSRNRSLDRLAHERRMQPTDEDWMLEPRDPTTTLGDPEREAVRQEAHDLVWDAASVLGERDASILDLHVRHGFEARELAAELGIEPNAANQALHRMRGRLRTAINARILWHRGRPDCDALAGELDGAQLTMFEPRLVRVIDRHAKSCDACAGRQLSATRAMAAFAAVPFVAAAPFLRTTSAQALAAQGVPVPASWSSWSPATEPSSIGGGAGSPDPTDHHGAQLTADRAAQHAATSGSTRSRRLGAVALAVGGVLLLVAGIAGIAGVLGAVTPFETPTPSPASPAPSASPTRVHSPLTPTPSPTPTPIPTVFVPPPERTEPPSEPGPDLEPPVVPAPTVRLSAAWIGVGRCPDETPFLYRITWSTTDAEVARLGGTWGRDEVALSGSAERCGARIAQFTLTATGRGGEVIETVEAEATPPS